MQVLDCAELNEISRQMMFVEGFLDFMFRTVQSNNQRYQLTEVSHQQPSIIFTQFPTTEELSFNLIWTLRRKENWSYQFEVRPDYLQRHGVTLKADNHSSVIEFLELITNLNAQQKYWTAFISSSDQLHLKYTLQPKPFIFSSYKIWWQELMHSALLFYQKIIFVLEPYCLEPIQTNNKPQSNMQLAKIRKDDDLTNIYLEMLQGQVRSKTQFLVSKEDSDKLNLRVQRKIKQITEKKYQKTKRQRQDIVKQHQQSFRILGIQQPLQWNKKTVSSSGFHKKRDNMNPTENSSKGIKYRNVQAIKNIKPMFKKKIIDPGDETHCTIRMGVFHVQLVESINPEVNKTFQNQRKLEERNQIQQQIELVLKTPDNKMALSIINSFKNELKFIKFIRNSFGCPSIANFYIEQTNFEQNEENNHFLMDFYSMTFEDYIGKRQGSILSKLKLLSEIVKGLLWLSDMKICHRDIKPKNIMIDFSGKIKIIDFGGCCPQIRAQQVGSFKAQTNRFLGTATYYSDYKQYNLLPLPQKHSKDAYRQHPTFDVYSFGRVMQETLSQDLDKLKDVGEFLRYIWNRCMSLVPEDRPTFLLLDKIFSRVINYYSSQANLSHQ